MMVVVSGLMFGRSSTHVTALRLCCSVTMMTIVVVVAVVLISLEEAKP